MQIPDGCPLTRTQFEILALLANGHSREHIAELRGVTLSTIRTHLSTIYTRLGARTAAGAVAVMFRRGWFTWTPAPQPSSLPPALDVYLRAFDVFLKTGHPRARVAMTIHTQTSRKEAA